MPQGREIEIVVADDAEGAARIEFLHCPFRELAEAYPELVCNLHRGLCEGVVDQVELDLEPFALLDLGAVGFQ